MAQIFPIDFSEKTTIAQNDYILFSDSEDGNKIKKAQYSNLKWEQWNPGTAATITVWSTTTWAAWSSASVTNSWTTSAAVFNFTIPKWDKGDTGDTWAAWESATIAVWTTTTWEAWTNASVTNSWTSSAAVFNFTIPKGDKWDTWATGADGKDWADGKDGADWAAATITVWSTTTGNPWTSASVVNSWTSSAAVFDFTIPQWATGATGNGIASVTSSKSGKITTVTITETDGDDYSFQISDGADWQWAWDVVWPASSTDWDVVVFDWSSGKLIKDGSVSLSTLSAWASAWATAVQPWDLWTAASKNTWTSSWNVPVLDSNWKLATSTLPWVALTDTYTVTNKSDLTSLSSAEQWDIGIVTSESKTYVLSQSPYSTAANWKELLTPTDSVTSVNWQTWAVTVNPWITKIFTLPNDVTTAEAIAIAQDAYDWFIAWNVSVLKKWSAYYYVVRTESSDSVLAFYQWRPFAWDVPNAWITNLVNPKISLSISAWTVTAISTSSQTFKSVLATWVDYTVPYTPEYNWSPATKKYVDDGDTVVSWDSWTTYTIKVSSTAPGSWTPATTITFVTSS